MVKVLIVNKLGQLKESCLKSSLREELYKKAGFKKSDGFDNRTIWSLTLSGSKIEIELWAKDEGKAGTENKYDFPPPVDTVLYFGSCVLLKRNPNTETPEDLTIDIWTQVYEKLFGGFENLDGENSDYSEDELAGVPQALKTKDGYLKDGFICEDGGNIDSEDDLDDDISEDGEDNIIMESSNRSRLRVNVVNSDSDESDDAIYCGYDSSELAPDQYIYSDEE